MLGAWPQVSLCVRAGRRFGVLVLGAAEPRWAMRCSAMSCWLLQGPALCLAVSWYALLALPVHTAGAGVGLVIDNRIAYMGSAISKQPGIDDAPCGGTSPRRGSFLLDLQSSSFESLADSGVNPTSIEV